MMANLSRDSISVVFILSLLIQSSVTSPSSLLLSTTIDSSNTNNNASQTTTPPEKSLARGIVQPGRLRVPKDEFNSTESVRFNIVDIGESNSGTGLNGKQALSSLKNLLLRSSLQDCCPRWRNLTNNVEIVDELRRKFGATKHKSSMVNLRGSDLLGELSLTFDNITYLSIDGQPGNNEREKYYSFYDNVQYFLRLLKVAHEYQTDREQQQRFNQSLGSSDQHDIDFNRKFHRQLKSLEFKAGQDPVLSSFIQELVVGGTTDNHSQSPSFNFYEDFLSNTKFGRHYARNISMIRESVMVFDQICSHLEHIDLLGNLTKPSKQYELIRRMSFELYQIRNDLIEQISLRVLSNRHDVQRIFARLNDFTETRPYIRMLGDQFSKNPPNYRDHVRQITQLLDSYLRNNMTQASFYNSLAELPEDFIMLGSSIAHYYETKEIPYFSKFDADYFNRNLGQQQLNNSTDGQSNKTKIVQKPTDARQSNLSLLTRLFN